MINSKKGKLSAILLVVGLLVMGMGMLHTDAQAQTGSIEGTVSPADAGAMVHATNENGDSFSAEADASTGAFELADLPDGVYTLEVEPTAEGYEPQTIEGLEVTSDEVTDAGEIELTEAGDGWK